MQRITISIDDGLASELDALVGDKGYGSRSEAMRDIARAAVERWRQEENKAEYSVAALTYVFDRRVRSLAELLARLEHAHHDLVASSTTLRLDHDHSLVSVMFKGRTSAVKDLANQIATQRGVTFPEFNLIGVARDDHHASPDAHEHHHHNHLAPLTT